MSEQHNITADFLPVELYDELTKNGWIVMKGIKPGGVLSLDELDRHLTDLYSSDEYNRARGSYRRINELVARYFFNLGRNTAGSWKITEEARKIYNMALTVFDVAPQRRMAIEEASELIEALVREDRGRANKDDVITELADVLIMCEQLSLVYGEKEVLQEKARKLDRLAERLKKYR